MMTTKSVLAAAALLASAGAAANAQTINLFANTDADGWRTRAFTYQVGGNQAAANAWVANNFAFTGATSFGGGAFENTGGAAALPAGETNWAPGNTSHVLTAQSFTWQSWYTGFNLSVAIDNDVRVFLRAPNGTTTNITFSNATGTPSAADPDYLRSEGPALRGRFTWSGLSNLFSAGGAGTYTLFFDARDRGGSTYFDARATAIVPLPPASMAGLSALGVLGGLAAFRRRRA